MEAVLFSLALALLLAGGVGASILLLPRGEPVTRLELASLSILFGSGFVSISSFLAGFFLSGWWIRGFVGALAVSLGALGWSKCGGRLTAIRTWPQRIAALILLAQLLIVIWASLRLALGFDGLFIWESKALLIFQDAGVMPAPFISGSPQQFTHPNYPLLLPLTESWFYGWMGEPNQGFVKLVSPLFHLSIVGTLVTSGARLGGNIWRGMIPAILFFFLPWAVLRTTAGEADIPLAAYYLAAVAYLLQYWDSDDRRSLLVVGSLSALLPWVKREGLILWACLMGIVLLRAIGRRHWREFATVTMPGVLVIGGWYLFLVLDRATEQKAFLTMGWRTLADNIGRMPTIVRAVIAELVDLDHWSLTWLVPVIGIVRLTQATGRRLTFVWLALILVPMSLYAGIYVFSAWVPFTDHIGSSLARLLVHLAPVALLGISLLWRDERSSRDERPTSATVTDDIETIVAL